MCETIFSHFSAAFIHSDLQVRLRRPINNARTKNTVPGKPSRQSSYENQKQKEIFPSSTYRVSHWCALEHNKTVLNTSGLTFSTQVVKKIHPTRYCLCVTGEKLNLYDL